MMAWALSVFVLVLSAMAVEAEGGPGDLWQTFTASDGLGAGSVAAVLQAQDGALWFGTDVGASRYDGVWQSFTERDGLPAGRIRAIAQTRDGALWFGSQRGGLGRCAADLSACAPAWTTAQGLPDNDVYTLLPDPNGNGLWIGTARGVAFLEGEHVTSWVSGLSKPSRTAPCWPVPTAAVSGGATQRASGSHWPGWRRQTASFTRFTWIERDRSGPAPASDCSCTSRETGGHGL